MTHGDDGGGPSVILLLDHFPNCLYSSLLVMVFRAVIADVTLLKVSISTSAESRGVSQLGDSL